MAERIRAVETGLLPPVVLAGAEHRKTLAARMKMHGVSAVSVAVINNGKLEWSKGYGTLAKGSRVAANAQTLFQAASISKAVTAAAVMRLVEKGRLNLDVDVNRYLKSWKVDPDRQKKEPVTLRTLLSHTSGINAPEQSAYSGDGQPYKSGKPLPTTLQVLKGEPPAKSDPVRPNWLHLGGFAYSGGGYTIIQQLLEDVTGKTFDVALKQLVLDPAGMKRSTFAMPLPRKLWSNTARAHNKQGRVFPGGWTWLPEKAAGGLWTTASDLARFCLELIKARQGQTGRLLSPKSLKMMTTAVASTLPLMKGHMGLGLFLRLADGARLFRHGGHNPGFHAILYAWPAAGRGLVIITNRESNGGYLLGEIQRAIAAVYRWPRGVGLHPHRLKPVTVAPATLSKYAGDYLLQFGATKALVKMRVRDKTLHATFGSNPEVPLRAYGKTKFIRVRRLALVHFEVDKTGKATGFTFRRGGKHKAVRVK